MKMAQYWESQEKRWHEKYIEAEKVVDKLESKIFDQASRIETLEGALRDIIDLAEVRGKKAYLLGFTPADLAKAALGENNV